MEAIVTWIFESINSFVIICVVMKRRNGDYYDENVVDFLWGYGMFDLSNYRRL